MKSQWNRKLSQYYRNQFAILKPLYGKAYKGKSQNRSYSSSKGFNSICAVLLIVTNRT